jgi:hypothetical protein
MEISDIVYLAFATIVVIVILHVGVFWVSRLIQPPKPKIVYVDRTPTQPIVPEVVSAPILHAPSAPHPPAPLQSMARDTPQTMSIPTYDMPPPIVQSNKPQSVAAAPTYELPPPIVQSNKPEAQLPPPLETRNVDQVGFTGKKGAPPQ